MRDAQDPLRSRFREIGLERIRNLNQGVLALEQGDADSTTADAVMREIHTLKGESRMLGLPVLNRVAHRTEDLLLHARRAGRLRDPDWLVHVYAGFDLLADLLQRVEQEVPEADADRAQAFLERVASALAEEGVAPGPTPTLPSAPASAPAPQAPPAGEAAPSAPAPPPDAAGDPPATAGRVPSSDATVSFQRVTRETIDEITRTAGEIGVLQAHLRQFAEDAGATVDRLRARLALLPERGDGELTGVVSDLERVLRAMRDVGFDASIRQHRLQAAVERMRLTSVGTLFDRFPRTVRDLAQDLGKEARLVVEGREVGADQQVLDLLFDPLLHLVRNALDHGLEPTATRESEGKPRRGTIRLGARQAGRFVDIVVGDDGRGIDPGAIAEAAVRKGLLSEADVGRMSEREILEQLFRPAFSTRATVSDVSGRGVGLDVVKSAIEDLGGTVRIDTRLGQGTDFVLRIPVSIALVDALVLDLGCALYAVPSTYVERILELEDAPLERSGGRELLRLDDVGRIPLLDLPAALGFPGVEREAGEPLRAVVVAEESRRVAFRVPAFVGELALVQEALDPFLKGLRLVTGTAMLDGGRRAVMLNGVQLLELAQAAPEARPSDVPAKADAPSPRLALVVEDSDLTRSMLVSTLTGAGWRVHEAVNGRQGLEAFAEVDPDVVITDLQMPILDGFDVIRSIRTGTQRPAVPIVVFSTVTDDVLRRRAADAGADVYVLKSSFVAEDLLATLDRLVAEAES